MLDINDFGYYYLQMILQMLRKLSSKLDHLVWYLEMRRKKKSLLQIHKHTYDKPKSWHLPPPIFLTFF